MTLTLVLGPAGSGKTQALVERAAQRYRADPFAPTLVLVPTSRHADQFRRQLVAQVGAAFALEVATLSGWTRDVVAAAGARVASRGLTSALIQRAIDHAVVDGSAAAFEPIREARGLVARVSEAIEELVAEGVPPSTVAAAELPELSPFAGVYRAFAALAAQAGVIHPAATPAEAAKTVLGGAATVPPLVLVDGYDYLHDGELRLVVALSQAADVLLALDPSASARAASVQARLGELAPSASVERVSRPSPVPARVALSAADRDTELRTIARDIKDRLTSDPTLRPSDFAVAFRQVTPLLPMARQIFHEYSLPFDPAAGFALATLPFGTWTRRFLRLAPDGWRLRDLIAVLRSDFIDRARWRLDRGHVAAIVQYGRENHLWAGSGSLRELAAGLSRQDRGHQREAGAGLVRLLDDLAPLLDVSRSEAPGVFAGEFDRALFGASPIVRPSVESRAQVDAFRGVLRGRIEVDEVIGAAALPLAVFVDGLIEEMEAPALALREAGGVVLASLHSLHGLRFHYLAVGGLVEGEFPASRRVPGLLNGEARTALPLPAAPGASEEELFASAVSRVEGVLVLTRPRLDGDGRPRAASHFFPGDDLAEIEPWRIQPERTASLLELALALVHEWPGGTRRPEGFPAWETVRLAAGIEGRRRSFETAGIYDGRLPAGAGAALTTPETRWSASRLETYVICSFQFFANYGLHIGKLDQELVQADAAILGSVVHEIVEAAVRPLVDAGRPLSIETLADVQAHVAVHGHSAWDDAPRRHGFGRAGLWRLRWPRVRERIQRMLTEEALASTALGMGHVRGVEFVLETTLALADGPLRFGGKVDRIDEGEGCAVVVDYKSGRPIAPADIESAQRLQLQLYAAALSAQEPGLGHVTSRFAYLRPTADRYRATVDGADGVTVEAALQRASDVRARVAAGRFEVRPGPFLDDAAKRVCPTYCPFKYVCRVTPLSRWKQWD